MNCDVCSKLAQPYYYVEVIETVTDDGPATYDTHFTYVMCSSCKEKHSQTGAAE